MVYDTACRQAIDRHANAAVPWFLIASYLHHHADCTLLSAEMYDALAAFLLERWDEISHVHRDLLHPPRLRLGTPFRLPLDEYPEIAIVAARRFRVEGPRPLPTGPRQ